MSQHVSLNQVARLQWVCVEGLFAGMVILLLLLVVYASLPVRSPMTPSCAFRRENVMTLRSNHRERRMEGMVAKSAWKIALTNVTIIIRVQMWRYS